MFNLFNKKEVPSVQTVVDTIQEIHDSFDNSADRLLKEAQAIVELPISEEALLKKHLGFINAIGVQENDNRIKKITTNKELMKNLLELSNKYPAYKFIHESKAREICEKYGLLMGNVSLYKDDIPTKNLKEIAAFKDNNHIKEEDMLYIMNIGFSAMSGAITNIVSYEAYLHQQKNKGQEYQRWLGHNMYIYAETSFSICAPKSDMKTEGMRLVDGYKLEREIPDPIVLFPVRDGYYVIVSKWGLEGQDASLVNEKMN